MDSKQPKSTEQLNSEKAAEKINIILKALDIHVLFFAAGVREENNAPAIVASFKSRDKKQAEKERQDFLFYFYQRFPALNGKIKLIERDTLIDDTSHEYEAALYIPANDPIIVKIANPEQKDIISILQNTPYQNTPSKPNSVVIPMHDNDHDNDDQIENKKLKKLNKPKNPIDAMDVPRAYKKLMHSNDDIDSVVKRDDSAQLAYKLLENYSTTSYFKDRHFKSIVDDFLKNHRLNKFSIGINKYNIWDTVSGLLFGRKTGPARGQELGEYIEKFVDFLVEKEIKMTKGSSLLNRIIYLANIGNASYKNLDNNVVWGAVPEGHPKPDVKNNFVIKILEKLKFITTSDAYQHAESILNPSTESKLNNIKDEGYVGVTSAAGAKKTDERTPEQIEKDIQKTVYKYTPHR